jgi:hypothetical protein
MPKAETTQDEQREVSETSYPRSQQLAHHIGAIA